MEEEEEQMAFQDSQVVNTPQQMKKDASLTSLKSINSIQTEGNLAKKNVKENRKRVIPNNMFE